MIKWRLLAALVAVLAGLIVSCGREEPVGTLLVVSEPPGATVVLDGEDTGRGTPAEFLLGVGERTVSVHLAGYLIEPAFRSVHIPAGRLAQADFTLAQLGELTVTSDPAGAGIVLDGDVTGEVTPHTFSIVVGEHTVEVLLEDYMADGGARIVDVVAGTPLDADFDLLPAGILTVTSSPDAAAVFIDGEDTGEFTAHSFLLPVGDYAVSVVKSGYTSDPASQDATVTAGAETTTDFTLIDEGLNGTLNVNSLPTGAAIFLDGVDTGEITPHTFDLPAGSVEVTVARRNFHDPDTQQVTVIAAGELDADFSLSPRKIVLMETVSAVNCVGCPAMHEEEAEVVEAGYGTDRVVGIQYSQGWLGPDPHYDANPADNIARTQNFYGPNTPWTGALPAMFLDGALSESSTPNFPQPAQALMDSLDAHLLRTPGFAIDVTVDDIHATTFTVEINLVAVAEVNGPNAKLHVCVVETPVLYDEPPGDYGETEFHWVMREFETVSDAPLPLAPGVAAHFTEDFTAGSGWIADNLAVIAFIQDDVTLEVLQAGITESTHQGDKK